MRKTSLFKKLFLLFLFAACHFSLLAAADFYWENPAVITDTDSRFPLTLKAGNGETYLFWQEIDSSSRQIYLSVRKYSSLKSFSENRRFAGPFGYSGDEVPDIYTAAVLKKGTVGVAVMTGLSNLSVYVSSDDCKSFTERKLPSTSQITVAPRIYATGSDSFRLFTSVGEENSFTIFTTDSPDGLKWSKLAQFQPALNYRNPFIPVLLRYRSLPGSVYFCRNKQTLLSDLYDNRFQHSGKKLDKSYTDYRQKLTGFPQR